MLVLILTRNVTEARLDDPTEASHATLVTKQKCCTVIVLQTVSYFDGTAAGNRGGFRWGVREESSGGSSQTRRGCPGSGTQEDQELAATQTHQLNASGRPRRCLMSVNLGVKLSPVTRCCVLSNMAAPQRPYRGISLDLIFSFLLILVFILKGLTCISNVFLR